MSTNATTGDSTDCPAAAPDFDFSDYLDVCRVCIAGNADVSGLGIIVGILLQAALMNSCVIVWWFLGPGLCGLGRDLLRLCRALKFLIYKPTKLYETLRTDFRDFGAKIRVVDGSDRSNHELVNDRRKENRNVVTDKKKGYREKLQKLFKSWSDVQAVTGIALLFAAILQNSGSDLSLYHTAIVLDLIAVAADGQAIMLFYAFKTDSTISSRAEEQLVSPELHVVPHLSVTTVPTTRERLLNVDRGIWPRLVSSLVYLVLDFIFSFKAFLRYRNSDGCFLSSKPRRGNYGTWGIASAILVLCVYVPIFVPQNIFAVFFERLGRIIKNKVSFLYPAAPGPPGNEPSDGEPAGSEGGSEPASKFHVLFAFLKRWLSRIAACTIWVTGRMFEWILKRELSFPIGTLIYFLWNTVDIVLLKKTNQVLLIGGGEEENSFAGFGQIVPIVMVFAVAYPICDVLQEKKVGFQRVDTSKSSAGET